MPLELEDDWAIIRPNRHPSEKEKEPSSTSAGCVWVAFCYQGDVLTSPRVRVQIPTVKELVEKSPGACMLDVFRVVCPISDLADDSWISTTDIYVDRMLLYFSEKGGPCIAEAARDHMPVLNLSMVDSIDMGFIVSGLGQLMILHRRSNHEENSAAWESAPWFSNEEQLVGLASTIEDRIDSPIRRLSTNRELQAFGRNLRAGMGMSLEEALADEPYYPPGLSR